MKRLTLTVALCSFTEELQDGLHMKNLDGDERHLSSTGRVEVESRGGENDHDERTGETYVRRRNLLTPNTGPSNPSPPL